MRATRAGLGLMLLALAGGVAGAQQAYDEELDPPEENRHPPVLFLNERIIDLVIDRLSDQLADHYEFDEDQLFSAREVIKTRFPDFFLDNRDELVRAINQYTEAMLAEDPPTAEDVAAWSERTLPMINEFADLVELTAEDMREFMTDEQQIRLDGELAAFHVGMNQINHKMTVWIDGGYDWQSEWPRSEAYREAQRAEEQARRNEREVARRAAMGLEQEPESTAVEIRIGSDGMTVETRPTSQPTASRPTKPMDPWQVYTEDFIRRYQLNRDQQNTARKILRSLRDERDRHVRRHAADIESVKKQLTAASQPAERAPIAARLAKLNEPIERGFQKLKERLNTLPTRRQRAAVARAEMEAEALKSADKKPKPPQPKSPTETPSKQPDESD